MDNQQQATMNADEYKQMLHHRRTINNWKRNLHVDIPLDKFETFKLFKKTYLMLHMLDPELVQKFMAIDVGQLERDGELAKL